MTVAAVDSGAFFALSGDDELRAELNVEGASLEGYLFPDTYLVPWKAEGRSVATMMVGRLEGVFDEEATTRAAEIGMSRHEVLTLASIVLLRGQGESRRSADAPPRDAFAHETALRRESARLLIVCSLPPDPPVPPLGGFAIETTDGAGESPPLPLWTHDRITNHRNESTED